MSIKNGFTKLSLLGLILIMSLSLGLTGCSNNDKEPVNVEEGTSKEKETEVQTEEVKNSAMEEAEQKLLEALTPLPDKDTGVKLAAIESTLANSFWITMQEGYEDAAKEYGVSIDVMATETETDINGQLDIMKVLLSKDYNAIAVSPLTEHNLIPGIVEANNKGTKVVAVGNGVNEKALEEAKGKIEAYITSDFKQQGKMGAEFIIDKTGGKGKVAVIEGIPGATQSEARKNGAIEAFEAAGMEVLPVQTANFDRQQAYDLTAALIDAYPDIVGIACGNDVMALGAVEALKAKNMKDKVVVAGVDFIEEAKDSIENGELDATVAMSPYLFGKAGVITALKAIQGHEFKESVVWTPIQLISKENVATMEGWK
ncbi:substrate-binding domain-containing protein [Tissierella praeacuta]|uniref:sugar ABC transporter substrate-binding protein n=1 Tax=Tissierella praeacuta TaxID=43131 RepID=UPI001C128AF1|nr:substrate-binding domain-containing protein [Tissierella praeacuta]MBU5255402.1 substrate-binding domain-containing protein [Tissierella praeacuta]